MALRPLLDASPPSPQDPLRRPIPRLTPPTVSPTSHTEDRTASTNFEPGRTFLNERDFQDQLDGWFDRVNARTHKALRERPIDRLARELELMTPLPEQPPDVDRRWVLRVPPDPHLRFDTNDYSLDPGLVGRRVEVRVAQNELLAVALDTGELACRHQRSFARHRTVTDLDRARPSLARRPRRCRACRRDPAA